MTSSFPIGPSLGPRLQDYLKAAEAAIVAGDAARASRISAEGAERGFEHPGMLALAVYHFLDRGQVNSALRYASRARELAPRQLDVLNALGQTLAKLGRYSEAVAAYDAALRASPASFVSNFNMAKVLVEMSRLKESREHFLRALALDPSHAETMSQLAHIAAQQGDAAEARHHAQRVLRTDPGNINAAFAAARADILDGKFESALAALACLSRGVSGPEANATAQSLTGDALDGLGRFGEAFEAYRTAGELFRAAYAPVYSRPGQLRALDLAHKLECYFREARPESWQNTAAGTFCPPVTRHVFLVGFPRSGTTLLGQVLSSHPMIETMEERSCLIDTHEFVLEDCGLDRLAALSGGALDCYREAYWKRVTEAGAAPSRPVFIDKLPLNSALLCLVAKLFPDAKVLFAVRDPRDVVLSCFRRQFGMNAQMYELLTLESAATYYDAIQRLCKLYREKLMLDITVARHEDLITGFDREGQRLCAFLDLEFEAGMEQFAVPAREKFIDTPSAAQVARGLYSDARGKWRNYREQMSPVMPVLSEWVDRFGYPAQPGTCP